MKKGGRAPSTCFKSEQSHRFEGGGKDGKERGAVAP